MFSFKLVVLKCHFAAKIVCVTQPKMVKKISLYYRSSHLLPAGLKTEVFPGSISAHSQILMSPAGKRGLYWLVGASSLFWWCDYEQVCVISSCLQQHWCNHSRSEFHALESVSWQRFMLRAKTHFVIISYNMDQMLQINFKQNPLT